MRNVSSQPASQRLITFGRKHQEIKTWIYRKTWTSTNPTRHGNQTQGNEHKNAAWSVYFKMRPHIDCCHSESSISWISPTSRTSLRRLFFWRGLFLSKNIKNTKYSIQSLFEVCTKLWIWDSKFWNQIRSLDSKFQVKLWKYIGSFEFYKSKIQSLKSNFKFQLKLGKYIYTLSKFKTQTFKLWNFNFKVWIETWIQDLKFVPNFGQTSN